MQEEERQINNSRASVVPLLIVVRFYPPVLSIRLLLKVINILDCLEFLNFSFFEISLKIFNQALKLTQ